MALICDKAIIKGKRGQIWCEPQDMPCAFVRYCAVSMKYYQTDKAKKCKARDKHE